MKVGHWYNIQMNFENRSDSMSELLIADGIAKVVTDENNKKHLKIEIKKLCPEIYKKLNELRATNNEDMKEEFHINYEGDYVNKEGGLQYFSKWSIDETILNAVSRYFKDDVLYVKEQSDTYPESYSYFVKNGETCLRNGEKLDDVIANVNPNLVKELQNGNVKVSLPIGEPSDKWGTFELTKNNVELTRYENWRGEEVLGKPTLLLKGNIDVQFKNGTKNYTPEQLAKSYYDSKNNFKNKMNEEVNIVGLSSDCFKKMKNQQTDSEYYIVSIPCKREISSNEKISITLPPFYVENEEGEIKNSIYLGKFGGIERSVRVRDESGNIVQKEMKPIEIKKYYEETLSTSRLNVNSTNRQNDIESEEDEELDR